jgi:GntR family transcriptional regulator, transcriptional repressor for pyruvate dehydrogenase complex
MNAQPEETSQLPARRGATEDVAERIRLYIEREALEPGHRLGREDDLAKQFGVSRPTLREALRLLASSHLIRATKGPGGGIFVANTTEDGLGLSVSKSIATMISAETISIEELLVTRTLLEIPLAGLAAQGATAEQVGTMRELVAEARRRLSEGEAVLGTLDSELHRRIAEAAGNRLLAALTGWIGDVLQPSVRELIAPAIVEEVAIDQHDDIVEAIARGDATAAEKAMREHLAYVSDLVAAVERMDHRD